VQRKDEPEIGTPHLCRCSVLGFRVGHSEQNVYDDLLA
jgi:hypothetical protein